MCKVWDDMLLGVKWSLGDGKSIKFWQDNWVGDCGPLKCLTIAPVDDQSLENTVADYVTSSGEWNWSCLGVVLPHSVLLLLAAIKPPLDSAGVDKRFWAYTSSGKFSVQTAYKMQGEGDWHDDDRRWRGIWQWKGPQRIRVFLWLAAKNRLMTNVERKRRHLTEDDLCPMCGVSAESVLHRLRDCWFARTLWHRFLVPQRFHAFMGLDLQQWVHGNLAEGYQVAGVDWSLLFGVVCWALWDARNKFTFAGEMQSIDAVEAFVRARSLDISRALVIMRDQQPHHSSRVERYVGWSFPPPGFVKINTDGAMRGPLMNASAGGLIRDCHGTWLAGFAHHLGCCSVVRAELWGAYHGLKLAWELGFKHVILEVDSQVVLTLVTSQEVTTNENSALVAAITQMLKWDWHVQVTHTYREGNRCADWLANIAFSLAIGYHSIPSPPTELARLVAEDVLGVSFPRMCPNP